MKFLSGLLLATTIFLPLSSVQTANPLHIVTEGTFSSFNPMALAANSLNLIWILPLPFAMPSKNFVQARQGLQIKPLQHRSALYMSERTTVHSFINSAKYSKIFG